MGKSSRRKRERKQGKQQGEEAKVARAREADRKPRDISGLRQFDQVVGDGGPVLVDFWAPWCQPCKLVGPIFESLAEEYGDTVTFIKVNTQSNQQIAQEMNIRSIPTLVAFYGGEVFDVRVGAAPRPAMEKLVKKLVDKAQGRTLFGKVKGLFGGGEAEETGDDR